MNDNEIFISMINDNLNEMGSIIDYLYVTNNNVNKNKLLNRLRKNVSNLSMLAQGLQEGGSTNSQQSGDMRVFTAEELSAYNGKDGNPGYVAVNGVVYDVQCCAWAGAVHFGLTAGKDLTSEFSSCHAGQQILSKLKVVGMMAK